jgi:hypothetical protein
MTIFSMPAGLSERDQQLPKKRLQAIKDFRSQWILKCPTKEMVSTMIFTICIIEFFRANSVAQDSERFVAN